uniref:Uncharacterized protein n=1 Tax=Panagrolaimus sp. JU765 TaxID=591449 RepID=A0AC34QNS5_9BILA
MSDDEEMMDTEEVAEDEQSDVDYADFCDDSVFDGFLDAPPALPIDMLHEEILKFLRIGMDPKKTEMMAANIVGELGENLTDKLMGDYICEFISDCSPSIFELSQRFHIVRSVLSLWENKQQSMTEALNEYLNPEKQVNTIPGRNMTYFIRCLVEEKLLDPKDLLIATENQSSLNEKDTTRLRQVLFRNYNMSTKNYGLCPVFGAAGAASKTGKDKTAK